MAFSFKKQIKNVMPYHLRYLLAYIICRRKFYHFVKSKTDRVTNASPGPTPPQEILFTTALMHMDELRAKANQHRFLASGYRTMYNFLNCLDRLDFSLRDARAILELGCGGSRVIRHLRCIDGIRLVGTDVDERSVKWCRENIPNIEFHRNNEQPPLNFADKESFDLIFAYSVFTHIPIDLQIPWLKEIRRILRPGGFFIGTVTGEKKLKETAGADEIKCLQQEGHFTLYSDDDNASASTQLAGSWDVFQTKDYVLETFSSVMKVLQYKDAAQATIVLQKE
jgi:SAM-dependent methyltransferase